MKLPKQQLNVQDVLDFKMTESKMYARSTGENSNKMFSITLSGLYKVECFKTDFFLITSDIEDAVSKYNELP